MKKTSIAAAVLIAATSVLEAKPTFFMPETLYAASGIECSVYFAKMFSSVKPSVYAFEAISAVGNFWEDRWSWTPTEKDAGKSAQVVFRALTDDGLVDCVTTKVVVAKAPSEALKTKKITLALFTASFSNCLFQDQLRKRMREAGFTAYTPVGSHTGYSASLECDPEKGAPHDGYGGYTWGSFLTRYALSIDEIDNLQSEAEKDQLRQFGVKIPEGQAWRKALLRSPIVTVRDGKRVVDIQHWLDKVNGGEAPDYLLVILGGNGVAVIRPEKIDEAIAKEVESARKLITYVRAACPKTRIGIAQAAGGSIEQIGWGKGYGAMTSAFQGNLNRILYDRTMMKLVEECGDQNIVFVPFSHNIDPVNAFPRERSNANALHGTAVSGFQAGDALYAWLVNDLERQQ